jgi:hypothetical protein
MAGTTIDLSKPVTSTPEPQVTPEMIAKLQTASRVRSGAGWFLWIGILSVINSVILLTGGNWRFIFGLGVTQIVDYVAKPLGAGGAFADAIINGIIVAVLVLLYSFSRKGARWAFVVGMVLYAGDALIMGLLRDMFAFGFHVLALVYIWKGFKAAGELATMQAREQTARFAMSASTSK